MQLDLLEAIPSAGPPDLSQPLPQPTEFEADAGTFRVQRYALTDGQRAGVELLVVDSGQVRAAICPTRGLGLWKARVADIDLGWDSPVAGPIHPAWVPIDEPRGIGWLDGFDELLVRCGLKSFGAPDFDAHGRCQFPVHGRVANLPAQQVQVRVCAETGDLIVEGEVLETRFLQYRFRLYSSYRFQFGEPSLTVQDLVTNMGATANSMQLLYHINVGKPLLGPGATLRTAAQEIVARDVRAAEDLPNWPTYLPPTAGYAEQVYFSRAVPDAEGWATALLASADAARGFAVHFQADTLPYFSQWKQTAAEADGYVTGLEPATGFPNPRSFEESQGRTVELAAGASRAFQLRLEGISAPRRVSELQSELAALRGGQAAQTRAFREGWCMPR